MNIDIYITKKNLKVAISFIVLAFSFLWFQSKYSEKKIVSNPFKKINSANVHISAPETINLNQTFKVKVSVDTKKAFINAVGLNINYENDNLRVVNIDTTQSFCQFYPEKRFNDNLGKINLSCGSPSPGFSGQNDVLIIEFKPIKIGNTTVVIDPQSKVLLSDGKGTNIISEFPKAQIKIINSL